MLELYRNIKKLRIQHGLTQSELAELAGYKDRSMISKIESGKVDLSQSQIAVFAKIFGIEQNELFGFSGLDEVTENEGRLLNSYRRLDDDGKAMVDDMIERLSMYARKIGELTK